MNKKLFKDKDYRKKHSIKRKKYNLLLKLN